MKIRMRLKLALTRRGAKAPPLPPPLVRFAPARAFALRDVPFRGFLGAFSLIELSIVLVVIGLIIGSVVAGQSLIRAGEIRSVSRDLQRYQQATNAFVERYRSLPGDMNNAVSYWSNVDGDSSDNYTITCAGTSSASTTTCNGNGDNFIGSGGAYYYEVFRFWQHLANAQLAEGTYSGVTGGGGDPHCVLGTNCPKSRRVGSGFSVQYYATPDASFLGDAKGNLMFYGTATAASLTTGASLVSTDAWNLDTKMDDGQPGFGALQQFTDATLNNCITDANTYDLAAAAPACSLIFKLGV